MKKRTVFSTFFAVLIFVSCLSSCKSIDTVDVTSTAISETYAPVTVPAESIGGIILDGAGVTAVTAAQFPDSGELSETDEIPSDDTTETEQPPETTTTAETTAAATTAMVTTASTTTTAKTTVTTTTTAKITVETTTTVKTTAAATIETAETTAAATTGDVSAGSYSKNSWSALNHSYVKAVWISYIELSNHLSGKNESGFKTEFGAMLDKCKEVGINTVYVHVRSHGDAYYYSSLFPFTRRLGGTLGKKASFDPLKIMVAEAHSRNISIHAWINPLRLGSDSDMAATSETFPVGKWYKGPEKGKYVVNVNGTWYLNPAYDAVRKLIGDNVREIVSGYNVDGVHIDDYFYPTTNASFDKDAYASSGYATLLGFRISNVNAMVKEMYTATHECGTAIFGAAPQGNNINNLNQLYADVKSWTKGRYIDYFTPQIYYGFENSGVPFADCVDEWAGIVKGTSVKLYAGLSVYKAGCEDKWAGTGKTEWQNTTTMLKRQKEYADKNGCSGIALYSYSYLFDSGYATKATKTEFDNLKPLLLQ